MMRAAILHEVGAPLDVADVPRPRTDPDGILVEVAATPVISYSKEVFSGEASRTPPPVPYIPGVGAVGRVVEASPATGAQIGDLVFVDPSIGLKPGDLTVHGMFIGWFGLHPDAGPVLDRWKDGGFAEYTHAPAECVAPIGPIAVDPRQLTALHPLTIAYGALERGGFTPGQTVIVTGATGNIGAAAVLLAAQLGASRVTAVGRNRAVLDELDALGGNVTPVALTEDPADWETQITEQSSDLHIDILGRVTDPTITAAALASLNLHGTSVWVGGARFDLPVPYGTVMRNQLTIKGSFMYRRHVPTTVARLIASGTIDLDPITVIGQPLADINTAIEQAATSNGLNYIAVTP